MKIEVAANGNLRMTPSDKLECRAIRRMHDKQTFTAEGRFIKRFLRQYGYKQVKPEDCGALTAATLITKDGEMWGDMNYQIQSFIETLAVWGTVTWQKGEPYANVPR